MKKPAVARVLLHTTHTHAPFALGNADSFLSIEAFDPATSESVPAPAPVPTTGAVRVPTPLARVSGGISIANGGWYIVHNDTAAATAIWAARTPPNLPQARQLYVDGERASRTKMWWPTKGIAWAIEGSNLVGTADASSSSSITALRELLAFGGKTENNTSRLASGKSGASATPSAATGLELVWTGGCKERAAHCAPGQHSYREARCAVSAIKARTTATPAEGSSSMNGPIDARGGEVTVTATFTVTEPCFSRVSLNVFSCTSIAPTKKKKQKGKHTHPFLSVYLRTFPCEYHCSYVLIPWYVS